MLLYRSRGEFLRERSPGNGSFRWMFPRYSKEWAAVIRDERNTVYRRLPFFNANVSNSVDGPRGPAEVGAVQARWTNFKSISVFREFAPVFWKRRMNGELESLWKFVQKYIYIYFGSQVFVEKLVMWKKWKWKNWKDLSNFSCKL